jgi:hypothetical protein
VRRVVPGSASVGSRRPGVFDASGRLIARPGSSAQAIVSPNGGRITVSK